MPKNFFSDTSWREQVAFPWDDNVFFVLDQHAIVLTSSLEQQYADRLVASHRFCAHQYFEKNWTRFSDVVIWHSNKYLLYLHNQVIKLTKIKVNMTHLDVHILHNRTNTVKTKNSNDMVNFLPNFSIIITVTNNPTKINKIKNF